MNAGTEKRYQQKRGDHLMVVEIQRHNKTGQANFALVKFRNYPRGHQRLLIGVVWIILRIFELIVQRVFFGAVGDRKSTRLNSSHGYISYAVFCLKKKKKLITYY